MQKQSTMDNFGRQVEVEMAHEETACATLGQVLGFLQVCVRDGCSNRLAAESADERFPGHIVWTRALPGAVWMRYHITPALDLTDYMILISEIDAAWGE